MSGQPIVAGSPKGFFEPKHFGQSPVAECAHRAGRRQCHTVTGLFLSVA